MITEKEIRKLVLDYLEECPYKVNINYNIFASNIAKIIIDKIKEKENAKIRKAINEGFKESTIANIGLIERHRKGINNKRN